MAASSGRIVRSGTWRYDDAVDKPVDIVALDVDWWFRLGEADGTLEPGEEPQSLGPDGVLYYVRFVHAGEPASPTWPDSPGNPTIAEAQRAAEAKAPTPITWSQGR